MKILKKKKTPENKEPIVKRPKVEDSHPTKETLKFYFRELDKDIKPKHLAFLLEYICNGFVAYKAYMKIYPNCSKHSAECLAGRILKHISIGDLLNLCGFGYEKIINDLGKLGPDRRLHYLIKLHRLDYEKVEHAGAMNVTVIPPPAGESGKKDM